MSWAPPQDDDRARWARNLEHVRAIRAALADNRLGDLATASHADLDAAEASERHRYAQALRLAAAEARAAQETAQEASEDSDTLAEVIELRPAAGMAGK